LKIFCPDIYNFLQNIHIKNGINPKSKHGLLNAIAFSELENITETEKYGVIKFYDLTTKII
jgi:hypothetical protein